MTVKVKGTECETEPEAPVTVIGYDPAGVDAAVNNVRVDVQPGLQDEGENVAVVPDGIPVAERVTDWLVPETRPAVTVYATDCPAVTLPLLESESEKSKTEMVVNVKFGEIARFPAASFDRTR